LAASKKKYCGEKIVDPCTALIGAVAHIPELQALARDVPARTICRRAAAAGNRTRG
jgi:hypothetical protein